MKSDLVGAHARGAIGHVKIYQHVDASGSFSYNMNAERWGFNVLLASLVPFIVALFSNSLFLVMPCTGSSSQRE